MFYRPSTWAEGGGSSFLKTLQSFIFNLVRRKQLHYVDLIVWSIRMLLMTTEVCLFFFKIIINYYFSKLSNFLYWWSSVIFFGRAQHKFCPQDEKILDGIIKTLEDWMKNQQYKVIQRVEVEVCNFLHSSNFIYV